MQLQGNLFQTTDGVKDGERKSAERFSTNEFTSSHHHCFSLQRHRSRPDDVTSPDYKGLSLHGLADTSSIHPPLSLLSGHLLAPPPLTGLHPGGEGARSADTLLSITCCHAAVTFQPSLYLCCIEVLLSFPLSHLFVPLSLGTRLGVTTRFNKSNGLIVGNFSPSTDPEL